MSITKDDFPLDDQDLSRLTFSSDNEEVEPKVEKKKRLHSANKRELEPLPDIDDNTKQHGGGHRLRRNSMIVTQLVKARRRAATAVSRQEIKYNEEDDATSCTIYDGLLVLIFGAAIFFGVVFILAALEDPPPELLNLGTELRADNDTYIGLFFLTEPSEDAVIAFSQAANRWSSIIAGSQNLLPGNVEEFACGFQFNPPLVLDHLNILVRIEEIDGAFDIVGSAGPCAFHNNIPTIGTMNLDSADIDNFADRRQLNTVILHEMAHVLGIGTLWASFGFIQNALPDNLPNRNRISPTYTGPLGLAEFQRISNNENNTLGIEDGFNNDGNANGAAEGAVNGHFDEDSMQTELMTFRIRRSDQALSVVTIRCLEDFGYTVSLIEADPFVLNDERRMLESDDDIIMKNDIIDPTPFLNEL